MKVLVIQVPDRIAIPLEHASILEHIIFLNGTYEGFSDSKETNGYKLERTYNLSPDVLLVDAKHIKEPQE